MRELLASQRPSLRTLAILIIWIATLIANRL